MAIFKVPKTQREVIATYNLAIIHLRQQQKFHRIGMTVGAGFSVPLKYPSWDDLVKRIAEDPDFKTNLLKELPPSSTISNTQRLYEYFFANVPRESNQTDRLHAEKVENSWKRILRRSLYKENSAPEKEKHLQEHPYLEAMLPIIADSNLVVNFNFDDSIEHALTRRGKILRPTKTRFSETRWDLAAPVRNDIPTVFHPNGYLAPREHEYSSDNIVFAEDSFLKRMTMGKIGDDSVLLSEYINNTYIHVGLSLRDEILKALLQRSWRAAPANIHYQIHFCREDTMHTDVQHAIADANFRVLNLITMFLGNEGTKSLFELVAMPESQFRDLAARSGANLKYTYYITGAVGSGKTTAVNHFKNLWAMDEWMEPSPDIISKPFDDLTEAEQQAADKWIGEQFCKKNNKLFDVRESVTIVDRCPLDPLTFVEGSYGKRAKELKEQLSPGKSNYKLEKGMVFILESEPYELRVRLIRKWKFWSEKTISKLIEAIKTFYEKKPIYVDTKGLTQEEVVRVLTRHMFFADYSPLDLDEILNQAIKT